MMTEGANGGGRRQRCKRHDPWLLSLLMRRLLRPTRAGRTVLHNNTSSRRAAAFWGVVRPTSTNQPDRVKTKIWFPRSPVRVIRIVESTNLRTRIQESPSEEPKPWRRLFSCLHRTGSESKSCGCVLCPGRDLQDAPPQRRDELLHRHHEVRTCRQLVGHLFGLGGAREAPGGDRANRQREAHVFLHAPPGSGTFDPTTLVFSTATRITSPSDGSSMIRACVTTVPAGPGRTPRNGSKRFMATSEMMRPSSAPGGSWMVCDTRPAGGGRWG